MYINKRASLRTYDSCSSNGTYADNFDGFVDENGAVWPIESTHSFVHARYTEYVIYDNTQAKMRYLVQIQKAREQKAHEHTINSQSRLYRGPFSLNERRLM